MRPSRLFVSLLAAAPLVACGGSGPSTVAPTATPPVGQVSPAPAPCPGDLPQERPDSLIYGADPGDFLADRFSLASGDFNADGFTDVLIGAPLADGPDNSRQNGGEAYVIFGSDSPKEAVDLADGADLTLYGEAADDNLGFTVASGDVNGDGVDDLLAGARFASHQDRMGAGKTYVIYGRPGLKGAFDMGRGQQDVTIVGREAGDFSAIALASGNVNGDGLDDLFIGASAGAGPDNDRPQAGEVYVVLGSTSLPRLIDLSVEAPHFVVYGANPGDSMPNYIASGDASGDGREELVLGAPFVDRADGQGEDAGEAYIVALPEGGGSLDLAAGQGFTRITGAGTRDGFGHFTAAGDVNGDAVADAVIGARDGDGPGDLRNNAGEVHVLFGRGELPASIDLAAQELDVTILGADPGDSLGFTVATGDLNGDGLDDILAGAPVGDSCGNARNEGGDVYAVLGRPDLAGLVDLAGDSDLSLFGAEAGDELGFSLATGDVNGDGKDDIIAGALLADGPDNQRPDAGEAYIVLSR